jgi:hypothetical protein
MGEEAQQRIVKLEQELLGPVQQKTANAVRTYAAEHSLKIVLDASTLQGGFVYVHDTADITTEIIRRIALNMDGPKRKESSDTAIGQIRLNRPWADFRIPRVDPRVSDPDDSLAHAVQQTP